LAITQAGIAASRSQRAGSVWSSRSVSDSFTAVSSEKWSDIAFSAMVAPTRGTGGSAAVAAAEADAAAAAVAADEGRLWTDDYVCRAVRRLLSQEGARSVRSYPHARPKRIGGTSGSKHTSVTGVHVQQVCWCLRHVLSWTCAVTREKHACNTCSVQTCFSMRIRNWANQVVGLCPDSMMHLIAALHCSTHMIYPPRIA